MPRIAKIVTLLVPVLLAACGSGDESVLAESCVRDGGEKDYCQCRAEVLAADLGDDHRKLLVRMSDLGKDGATAEAAEEKIMQETDAADFMAFQFAVMGVSMKAERQCR